MTTIKTVALAGATGSLGGPLLQALLDANFTVTALTRATSTSTFPASVKVAKVDYDDVESLTSAIKGHDALVSTIGTFAIDGQYRLIDAAVAAGVKRLIPSEFGGDMANPKASKLPAYQPKLQVREYVEKKCQGTSTTYTYVCNNMFFDWGLDQGWGLDVKNKKMEMYDGGEIQYTSTPIPFVAKGVVGVLQKPDETQNRSVFVMGKSMTQKQLLEIAKRAVGSEGWEVTQVQSADLEKQSYENLEKDPGDVFGWVIGFLKRAAFGEGYGGDFREKSDNGLLGLKELSDKEIEDIIRSKA